MEEDYNPEKEQDLTCGNPDCGCVQSRDSLSPMERDIAGAILPALIETAQKERRKYQDS